MNTQQRGKAARLARRRMVAGRLTAPVATDRHGLASTYQNHGCRCTPCTEAWARYSYDRTGASR